MATTKPRITITLDPHIHQTLQRASKANGQPMSEIVSGLLSLLQPTLEHMATTFERVQAVSEARNARFAAALEAALEAAEAVLLVPPGQIEITLADTRQPPYLTGGSGTPKTQRKTAHRVAPGSGK